ncbi:helix-turn-helix domain-containing protein [Ktedonosporobacter rubrisoli]|uniref:helix-turn-helix domain-containing protein n=1 Tax=Ktedonosporobacter rubrisoli TaxID=2509675 RepID=UPI0013EE7D96|nr:helix-turn-helix domain-containing protein [Ktedonosporobacter rubrisoli]
MRKAAQAVPNEQLKRERLRRGWSREYIAEQIGIADPKTIGRWERGVALPSSYFLQRLCELFALTAQDLGLYQEQEPGRHEPVCMAMTSDMAGEPVRALYDPELPMPLSDIGGLAGREEQFYVLKQRLGTEKSPVVAALSGLPGVGKTALAVELAHDQDIQQYFNGGILWVSPGPRPDIPRLLARWGALLGIDEPSARDNIEAWARALHAAIGLRRMLLIIDDAWKCADALAFKVGGPNCAYILTTRIPSVALQFANGGTIRLDGLAERDGLELLARFIPEVVASEPRIARDLVRLVAGLPLGLVVMGKYLQTQAYSRQRRRLQAALERLYHQEEILQLNMLQAPFEASAGPALSVQSALESSYRELGGQARSVLARLAAFPASPHSFAEAAALSICCAPAEALDELVDSGLLECTPAGRYTLHPLIAEYARLAHAERGMEEHVVNYYLNYTEKYATDYEALAQEIDNILACLQMAFERGMRASLIRGALAIAPFLQEQGLCEIAQAQLARAEQAARLASDSHSQKKIVYYLERIVSARKNIMQGPGRYQKELTCKQGLERLSPVVSLLSAQLS